MNAFTRGGRSRFVLVLLVLSALSLMTLDGRDFGPLNKVKSAAVSVISPFRSLTGWAFSPISNTWNGITQYSSLKNENEALRERLGELEGNHVAELTAREVLGEFLRATEIDFGESIPQVTAQVISGPVTPFEATVVINKGSGSGIKEGMAVVTAAGLVGRIEQVSPNESVVMLLSDPRLQVALRVVATQSLGRLEGRGSGQNPVMELSSDVALTAGDLLQTSGLRGSQYPAGIPVGRVLSDSGDPQENNETQTNGDSDATSTTLAGNSSVIPMQPVTTHRSEVQLAANLDQLNFLTVMLWSPG